MGSRWSGPRRSYTDTGLCSHLLRPQFTGKPWAMAPPCLSFPTWKNKERCPTCPVLVFSLMSGHLAPDPWPRCWLREHPRGGWPRGLSTPPTFPPVRRPRPPAPAPRASVPLTRLLPSRGGVHSGTGSAQGWMRWTRKPKCQPHTMPRKCSLNKSMSKREGSGLWGGTGSTR